MHELMLDKFILTTKAGICIPVESTAVLFFIDETGDQGLHDPRYPIFGIGGSVVPVQLYQSEVREKWNRLKDVHFNGRNKPLHATDIRNPTQVQLNALNKFFSSTVFGRVAIVMSNKTLFSDSYNLHEIAVTTLYKRLSAVISSFSFTSIVMIIEDSPIADRLLEITNGYKLKKGLFPIRIDKYAMPKASCEAGLEVSDFIINCAGTSVRDRLKGKRSKERERKDFSVIFRDVDKHFSDFFEITEIHKKE